MLKKTMVILSTLAIMSVSLVGCAKSDADLENEGWVKNPADNGYVLNPADNGWVLNPLDNGYEFEQEALPSARDLTKVVNEVTCTANNYAAGCSSIDYTNLHEYVGRDDVYYFDVRDYKSYGNSHLRGFEVVPYFDYIAPAGTWSTQLFSKETDGTYTAKYEESLAILKALFPQDKALFIMCQSGARVAQLMTLLDQQGYDMTKVYNIGGMNNYKSSDDNYKNLISSGNGAILNTPGGMDVTKLTPIA